MKARQSGNAAEQKPSVESEKNSANTLLKERIIMNCNYGFGGGNCCWIIIILLVLFFCCGSNNNGGSICTPTC